MLFALQLPSLLSIGTGSVLSIFRRPLIFFVQFQLYISSSMCLFGLLVTFDRLPLAHTLPEIAEFLGFAVLLD